MKKKIFCFSFAFFLMAIYFAFGLLNLYLIEFPLREALDSYGIAKVWMTIPFAAGFLYVAGYKAQDFVWVKKNISRPVNTPPIDVLKDIEK